MNTTCPLIKQNEGFIDRMIRIVVGFAAILIGNSMLSGVSQTIVYVVGAVALTTGIVGFCGLYTLLGITTIRKKKDDKTAE